MTYMPIHPFVFTKCQKYTTVVLFKAMSSQYIVHQFIHLCCNHKTVGIERTNISCESILLTEGIILRLRPQKKLSEVWSLLHGQTCFKICKQTRSKKHDMKI